MDELLPKDLLKDLEQGIGRLDRVLEIMDKTDIMNQDLNFNNMNLLQFGTMSSMQALFIDNTIGSSLVYGGEHGNTSG